MIAVIIQARMGSSRLPGKVLKKINGLSLLESQIDRVKKSKNIENIVVATSLNKIDNRIESLCIQKGITCFRGSEEDVLSRYYDCAKTFNISTIVRLTADCPLVDPLTIDKVIDYFLDKKLDYVSNTTPPETSFWPDGSDVEVFSFNALAKANKKATTKEDREHVTFFFWKDNKNGFKTMQLSNKEDWSDYRYTVDYENDIKAVRAIFREIKKRGIFGHVDEIVDILKTRSDITKINENYYFGIGWEK